MKSTNQSQSRFNVGKIFVATTLAITGLTAISSVAYAAEPVVTTPVPNPAPLLGALDGYGTLNLGSPTTANLQAVIEAEEAALFGAELGASSSFAAQNGFTLITTYENKDIFTNTTISLTSGGYYALDVRSIDLVGTTLTIHAPAGATVVVDISGSFLVLGGKIVLTGGISPKNIAFDLTGTAGGPGVVLNGTVEGNILAANRVVVVAGKSVIQGSVFALEAIVIPPSTVSPEY